MTTVTFYAERAAECRRDAEAASLANVRARCLSAAEAWDGMADRARRTQDLRAAYSAAKADGDT